MSQTKKSEGNRNIEGYRMQRRYSEKNQKYENSENRRNIIDRKKAKRKRRRTFCIFILVVMILSFSGGFALSYNIFRNEDVAVESRKSEIDDKNIEQLEEEEEAVAAVATLVYAEPQSDYERVINRSYPIESDYIAGTGELREIAGSGGKVMETNAAIALEEMVQGLNDAGMSIIIQSTYRTDADQEYLYNRQIQRQGGDELKAATISAVPLTSEHQAGLAVDLSIDGSLTEDFGSTEQGKWLKKHCAEHGYILRYLPENTEYTGIISEPWHFRYVGSPEVAQKIMASGKSMEEYYGKFLEPEDIEPYLPYLQQ